ncbi:hypothetical protein LIER_18334 [Lithospermum erythrorhizon]|uniref:Uncharacterized protein n=1 Tax=Lithospermum erythrorhizon TaxID=34254 RepID=A0AAV3QEX0_LITER
MFTTLPFLVDPFANLFFCLSSDLMSKSVENQADNFLLRPCMVADQAEASISGGIPLIQIGGPLIQVPLSQQSKPANLTPRKSTVEATRAKKACQDTRLALLREQLYLPCIEENSTYPDLTFGYTSVYVEAFSYGIRLPFSPIINNLLTTINRAHCQLLPLGGWLNVTIIEVACRIFPWYTFCDEAMLVAADEIADIAASTEPKLVDFDDMLMDSPSLFTRVAIVPKKKPRKCMIQEPSSISPPPTNNVHIPAINPLLKRMATTSPSVPLPSKKAKKMAPSKKKASQVLARDSSDEESQVHEIQPITRAMVVPANVVA